ncbi:hypothetical protein Asi03nite_62490 [Actinoplanes siamensis]|uniref:Uncharacterized protein n=1 Tax=Actinoplanes siamensis TaxID=1223317 RepID=A0A919NCQ3_9ACTN|nr:hypothetical protein Asi03nite_62490 [Actinoplanes siamensis]
MPEYQHPTYQMHELVSDLDCLARAQRALETAETDLIDAYERADLLTPAEEVAHAAARAEVGRGWAELARAIQGVRR